MWGGKVVGIPLSVSPLYLYYHRPIFERDALAVPQTWEQMAELVGHASMHGVHAFMQGRAQSRRNGGGGHRRLCSCLSCTTRYGASCFRH